MVMETFVKLTANADNALSYSFFIYGDGLEG
jgi:hypothetical protein